MRELLKITCCECLIPLGYWEPADMSMVDSYGYDDHYCDRCGLLQMLEAEDDLARFSGFLAGQAMGHERYLDSLSKTEPLPLNKED